MRLVIATPLYPPEPGGPATYAHILEHELPGRGHQVTVIKFSEVKKYPKFFRHLVYLYRVLRAAKHADLILVLDPVSTGLPAALAARVTRTPYIVKIVGDYAWEQGQQRFGITDRLDDFVQEKNVPQAVRGLRMVQEFVARNATRILVPSEYLKGIVHAWRIPKEKIRVVYNAVTLEDGGTVPIEISALPHPLVVSVARLVPWKGMQGLIDAVAEARKKVPTFSLAIVGSGPDRQLLETYASEKLGTGYVFTGGLSHPDTYAVMQAGDMFALNTSYEGFSHVLIEALSAGTATITTPVGGNGELITNEVEGLLVPHNDVPQWTSALLRLVQDSALKEKLEATAKEKVTLFTREVMVEKTIPVLTECL